jgi:molecular chaperone HtpG
MGNESLAAAADHCYFSPPTMCHESIYKMEETMSQAGEAMETRQFEAEVSQVLKLMVHSMYSHQEVFLRELISNASDAIDKLRFEALSDEEVYQGQTDLHIEIEVDKEARTVTVRDTGIGMSRDEVADNIGTIARSGTRRFLEQLTGDQKEDSRLIGQFGVGFYSAFIVADKVELVTRRAGQEDGVRWESPGEGEYNLGGADKEERGTEIVLHLREDADEFLDLGRLEQIVRRYSDHISFPIYLVGDADEKVEEQDEEQDDKKEAERRQINEASALWTRPRNEIDDEEYKSFYKHVAHAFDEPLTWIHSKVEGLLKFTLLFYVPTEQPLELRLADRDIAGGVKLYVKRVYILDEAEMFLPRYLRFVRGVVDADDLPLNVSREMLQDNRVVRSIRKTATKRALEMLQELSEDAEKYATFWGAFGSILKEGVVEDRGRQNEVAGLLRFASTAGDGAAETTSLDDYLARKKEGQEAIYYVTADSYEAGLASPHLEIFEARDVEVLVLTDPVDEWVVSHLREYEDVPLRSVDRGALELDDLGQDGDNAEEKGDDDEKSDDVDPRWAPLLESVKEALGDSVREVRMSNRLTDSPSCLVREEWEMSERMRRLLKQSGQEVPAAKPTLELNPDHHLIHYLEGLQGEELADWSTLFLEQARLSEGAVLEAPALFVRRLNRLMSQLVDDDGNGRTE